VNACTNSSVVSENLPPHKVFEVEASFATAVSAEELEDVVLSDIRSIDPKKYQSLYSEGKITHCCTELARIFKLNRF